MKKVELLLPAQNLKSIKAVVGKANAVYFGVETLNMRMNADNFSSQQLQNIVKTCHENSLRAYLTTNVIIYEHELGLLEKHLLNAKNAGIDAVIVHDFAAIDLCRQLQIPFHISTQASISNSKAAQFYQSLGADRLILARELSLEMIQEIVAKLDKTQVEVFVHGAQCTAISGRCYFSTCINDNPQFSANRGMCLQPCRHRWTISHENGTILDYDGIYFLNAKDLCMIEHIPELMKLPIAAFKVEGRMREPHYMEVVARCYREAIDSVIDGTFNSEKVKNWIKDLGSVYNRGFSTGFYYHRPTGSDINPQESGNLASKKKVQIGRVTAYFRDVQAAKLEIFAGQLQIGEIIYIEGASHGNFLKQIIQSMQIKKKVVTETPLATKENPVIVGIKVDGPVKSGDWIYKYLPV